MGHAVTHESMEMSKVKRELYFLLLNVTISLRLYELVFSVSQTSFVQQCSSFL